MGFTMKEKQKHYTAVANGSKSVKKNSKFTKKEQQAYARGQRDARNEQLCAFAYKNATPAERKKFKEKRAKKAAAYKASRAK